MSAEKCNKARVGTDPRVNSRVKLTSRPAVFFVEESIQSGVQIQLAWSWLMVCHVWSVSDHGGRGYKMHLLLLGRNHCVLSSATWLCGSLYFKISPTAYFEAWLHGMVLVGTYTLNTCYEGNCTTRDEGSFNLGRAATVYRDSMQGHKESHRIGGAKSVCSLVC